MQATTFHPGTTITFGIWADLTPSTTPLSEAADVDAEALSDTTVSVTLAEYGQAAIPTAKVRALSYIDIDPDVADIVAFAGGVAIDTLARTPMGAGTNVRYSTASGETRPTSRGQVEADDVLIGADVRYVVAKLRGANVRPFDMNAYAGIMHPDVSYDFRDTSNAVWADVVAYSEPDRRWNGEVGKFEQVRFMESPRAELMSDTGSPSTADVYKTYIFGKEALAKAFSSGAGYSGGALPTAVISDKADNLNRFRAVGWKWLGGFGRFREASLWRIESGSSIGTNV